MRGEAGLALVDIGDAQRAAGRDVAGDDPNVFRHAARETATDHRHVIGAMDGYGDELAVAAVAGHRGEAVGQRLASAELLDRGLGVVAAVSPIAVGGERERAVVVAARGAGLDCEIGLASIHIGDGQCAARGQITGHNAGSAVVFSHAADRDAPDHRHVIRTRDGDVDLLVNDASVLVVQRDGEAFDLGLAGAQRRNRRIRNRIGPGELAAGAGARGIGVFGHGERAQRDANRSSDG